MKKGLLVLAAACMTLMPVSASAAARGFGGHGFYGGAGFYRGAGFYGGGWGGYYSPFWSAYWGPYYGYGYAAYPNSGEVKLDTKVKDAQVFINGAFAGTTHDNRTMHLRPGNYNIEIKEAGNTQFSQKVYVAAGVTIHLHPEL